MICLSLIQFCNEELSGIQRLGDQQSVCNIWCYRDEVFGKHRGMFSWMSKVLANVLPSAEAKSYSSVVLAKLFVLSFPLSALSTFLPHGKGT